MGPALRLISAWGTHEVADGEHIIGRSEDATIVIDHPTVSREHLVVRREHDGWVLEDLGSRSGTFRAGDLVTRVKITEAVVLHLAAPDGPAIEFVPVEDERTIVEPFANRAAGVHQTTHVLQARLRIGRGEENDIVVDDLSVSRQHAVMRLLGGRFEIRDLKSANGTFVNGRRVGSATLDDGDLVEIGRHEFRFTDGRLEEYVDAGLITFSAQDLVVEAENGLRLVDGVDFSLDARSLLAVVGPSGAGKSTLLSVLTGLRPATQGVVLYEDRDLYRDGAALRSRIGVVPQADLLHDGLTIRRSLGYTERLRLPPDVSTAERVARVDEVLAQLGLDHRVDSRIDHLSGGERKRVNVATELLTEPSLLLLDEPASGLDAGLERTLMLMLRDLADEGHTVVVVTHSLDSLHLCDHLLVLAPGGIPAYFGPPDGAQARFGGEELVDVFHQMSDGDDDRQWRGELARSTTDEPRLPDGDTTDPKINATLAARTWLGQLAALSSRFARVLASDRRNALLLVLQAPVLGVLMAVALPTAELSSPGVTEIRFVSTAGLVLFVVLLGATWLGANNAIREIARERALFERERAVGLSTSAYVLSKAIVLGAITTVQAFILVPIALSRQGGPASAVLLGWPIGEIMLAAAFAGLASMSLALLISSAVGTPDRATTLLPIVLILQFVLSAGGVLPELTDKPVLRELSLASSAQWGFAATAATADLNELQSFTNQLGDLRSVDAADPLPAIEALQEPQAPNQRWAHDRSSWMTSLLMLGVLIGAPLAAAIVILRRRKPFA
jgi:ABC-type multidrug transport system ATPase subunit/pSer/pThr/pTyr-binding forkhead associated (FHA) protein